VRGEKVSGREEKLSLDSLLWLRKSFSKHHQFFQFLPSKFFFPLFVMDLHHPLHLSSFEMDLRKDENGGGEEAENEEKGWGWKRIRYKKRGLWALDWSRLLDYSDSLWSQAERMRSLFWWNGWRKDNGLTVIIPSLLWFHLCLITYFWEFYAFFLIFIFNWPTSALPRRKFRSEEEWRRRPDQFPLTNRRKRSARLLYMVLFTWKS